MKCLLLDIKTNKVKWHGGPSTFDWTENNWSCDCNRATPFGNTNDDNGGHCVGGHRYIVVDYILEDEDDYEPANFYELNSDYDKKLVTAAFKQYTVLIENIQEILY